MLLLTIMVTNSVCVMVRQILSIIIKVWISTFSEISIDFWCLHDCK